MNIVVRIGLATVLFLSLIFGASFYQGGTAPYDIERDKVQLKEVYWSLKIHAGEYGIPPLVIIDDPVINAWTDGMSITVTTGILRAMRGDINMQAMILAHEMAHDLLRHNYDNFMPTVLQETYADKVGAYLMLRSGYDICKGSLAFKRLMEISGDSPISDHPALAYRLEQLHMPWCPNIREI